MVRATMRKIAAAAFLTTILVSSPSFGQATDSPTQSPPTVSQPPSVKVHDWGVSHGASSPDLSPDIENRLLEWGSSPGASSPNIIIPDVIPDAKKLSRDALQRLQELLKEEGQYDADVDGVWGPETDRTLPDVCKRKTTSPQRKTDEQTITALNNSKNTAAYTAVKAASDRSKAIQVLQVLLRTKGYYDAPVDGIFGPHTASALENYQASSGLRVTGKVDQGTVRSSATLEPACK